jgi:hypothetical protein
MNISFTKLNLRLLVVVLIGFFYSIKSRRERWRMSEQRERERVIQFLLIKKQNKPRKFVLFLIFERVFFVFYLIIAQISVLSGNSSFFCFVSFLFYLFSFQLIFKMLFWNPETNDWFLFIEFWGSNDKHWFITNWYILQSFFECVWTID